MSIRFNKTLVLSLLCLSLIHAADALAEDCDEYGCSEAEYIPQPVPPFDEEPPVPAQGPIVVPNAGGGEHAWNLPPLGTAQLGDNNWGPQNENFAPTDPNGDAPNAEDPDAPFNDSDGDGISDYDEDCLGTDKLDPTVP